MKENKGITLIALVVTIIILLILAGVSITTLSGDGLFGRAQSSAAKYEQASQKENTTISSLMDKYDRYDRAVTEVVTVKWTSALAERGAFIDDATPADHINSSYYDKEIIAIEPDGTGHVLNPYLATYNATFPVGTKLRFYYYKDESIEETYMYVGDSWSGADAVTSDNKLYYIEVTLDKQGTCDLRGDGDGTTEGYATYWWIFSKYLGGPYK